MSYYPAISPMAEAPASWSHAVRAPVSAPAPPPIIGSDQMSPALDELSLKFAIHTRAARIDALDIGCGDGVATAAAIARGGHVMAVDPDVTALRKLVARIPHDQFPRLKLRVSSLPALDFKFTRFSAVHASRVLHLLEPDVAQASLRKFFRWLYPTGKLFLSTPAWDEMELRLQLEAAGFIVETLKCYPLPWNGEQLCFGVIARCAP